MDAPIRNGIDVPKWSRVGNHLNRTGAPTMKTTTVDIDLAKNVFQVHGVNDRGKAVLKKQLKRDKVAEFFVNRRTTNDSSRPRLCENSPSNDERSAPTQR
jgi:hypothetical protein